MSKIFLGTVTCAALLMTGSQLFAASIVIDSFNTEQRVSDVPGTGLVNSSQVAESTAIGGFRDMTVKNNNVPGFTDGTELRVFDGLLSFSNIARARGEGTITYDGDDDSRSLNRFGLGGIDLDIGANSAFTFDVDNFDASLFIRVSAYDTFGGMSFYEETLPEETQFSPILKFSEFIGNVDFNSIGALEFFVRADGPNLDGSISGIKVTSDTPAPVPLPAASLLLLGGLGSLPLLRARRRKS